MHLLLLKVVDGCLNGVLCFPKILVLAYSGGEVVRKEIVNDMIDCISEGCVGVKKALLLSGDGWAYVVDLGSGEWVCIDRISLAIGARYLGLWPVNWVWEEGGDDAALDGWVGDQESVVVGGPLSVGGPTLSRVWSTDLRLWGMHVIIFKGGSWRCGPQGIVFFIIIFIPS